MLPQVWMWVGQVTRPAHSRLPSLITGGHWSGEGTLCATGWVLYSSPTYLYTMLTDWVWLRYFCLVIYLE